MAFKIKLLRASSLDGLERVINDFFVEATKDLRITVSLAGGVSYAEGTYVAPVSISAPHKRTFDEADTPSVPRTEQ